MSRSGASRNSLQFCKDQAPFTPNNFDTRHFFKSCKWIQPAAPGRFRLLSQPDGDSRVPALPSGIHVNLIPPMEVVAIESTHTSATLDFVQLARHTMKISGCFGMPDFNVSIILWSNNLQPPPSPKQWKHCFYFMSGVFIWDCLCIGFCLGICRTRCPSPAQRGFSRLVETGGRDN